MPELDDDDIQRLRGKVPELAIDATEKALVDGLLKLASNTVRAVPPGSAGDQEGPWTIDEVITSVRGDPVAPPPTP